MRLLRRIIAGRAKASAVSHSSCYTVLVYALWSVLNVRVLGERWHAMAAGEDAEGGGAEASTLNHRIYHLILIGLLTHHWVVPVCIWPEARALAKYLNDWASFQVTLARWAARARGHECRGTVRSGPSPSRPSGCC